MDIQQNLLDYFSALNGVWQIFTNKVFLLGVSAQFFSMLTKALIKSIRSRSFSLKKMADYGGMPSSHTAFIISALIGIGIETPNGFASPIFGFAFVMALIILVDTVKFRGNVDKINLNLSLVVKENNLENSIKSPKFIAHKTHEVIAGVVFAFIYTTLFYALFK